MLSGATFLVISGNKVSVLVSLTTMVEDLAPTLQNTKDCHLPHSSTTPFPFTCSTKIALVQLNRTIKYFGRFQLKMIGNDFADLPIKQEGCIRLNFHDVSR